MSMAFRFFSRGNNSVEAEGSIVNVAEQVSVVNIRLYFGCAFIYLWKKFDACKQLAIKALLTTISVTDDDDGKLFCQCGKRNLN